jgi:hypothetical protein
MESISEYQFRRQQQGLIPTMEYGPGPKVEDDAKTSENDQSSWPTSSQRKPPEWAQ